MVDFQGFAGFDGACNRPLKDSTRICWAHYSTATILNPSEMPLLIAEDLGFGQGFLSRVLGFIRSLECCFKALESNH